MVEVFKRNLGVISSLCISFKLRLQKIKVPQVQMAVRRLLSCGRPDLDLALLAMPGA